MCFSNTLSTKTAFASNLKLNVMNIPTNASFRRSGGLKLGKENTCCRHQLLPRLPGQWASWHHWRKLNVLQISCIMQAKCSASKQAFPLWPSADQSMLVVIRNTTRTLPLLAAAITEGGWLRKSESRTTFIAKSWGKKGKVNGTEQKATKKRLQVPRASTTSTVYYCMHNRAELMHWLSLMSEFWYNLTSKCTASSLWI